MRAIVAGLVAGVLAAAAASPAVAAPHLTQIGLRTSGSIEVRWHGDRARGCAAAGLCGYRGSIAYPFRRGTGFIERAPTGPGSFLDYFGFLESPGRTVVRTERTVPGGRSALCSQRARTTGFTLSFAPAWGARHWLELGTESFPPLLASGQCAGPRLEDFAGRLPSTIVRRKALDRRGARVSLAGRFRFRSGPLSGTVISTLKLRSRGIRRVRTIDDGGGGDNEPRGKHELAVRLRYRVTSLEGEVRDDFTAVSAPICRVRDACGAHGSEVFSLAEAGKTLEIAGFARTSSRKRPPLRRALHRVVSDGFAFGDVPIDRASGLTTHAFVRRGGATCTDRFRPRRPPLLFVLGERGRVVLSLSSGGASVLRGRCPGVTETFAGGDELARTRVPVDRLLKRVLRLQLRAGRGFGGGAYSGTHKAHLDLRLRRTRAQVQVDPAGQRP